ncbi:MAG: Tim44/TimA family putative adaptor protein [Pseudomonadota bacterium]
MNGSGNVIDIITLVALVLAVVIFLKLRSVLGRRTGHERPTQYDRVANRESQDAKGAQQGAQDKVVNFPTREREEHQPAMDEPSNEEKEETIRAFAKDETLASGLIAINRADRSFNPEFFLSGAKMAYEEIVTAFADGQRKSLKTLLSPEVYEGFASAINEREKRGEQVDQSFVGINKAEMLEAEVDDGIAQVTIKFVSELISSTIDRTGSIISGDPKEVTEVTDIWTFAREINSRDPNWKLIATQPAN